MRLINADDLIERINAVIENGLADPDGLHPVSAEVVLETINVIPTATPEPHWIPVTERLPNRDELVLVTYKTGKIHLCKYLDDDSENAWWSYIDDCCAWNKVILAWMPLPESFKGVTE